MGAGDRRIAAWVDLVGDLLMQPTSASPHQLLSAGLSETFGCQVSYNWMDPDGSAGYVLHQPMRDWPDSASGPDIAAAIAHHPVLRWHGVTGDMAAMTIGRVPRAMVTDQGRASCATTLFPSELSSKWPSPTGWGVVIIGPSRSPVAAETSPTRICEWPCSCSPYCVCLTVNVLCSRETVTAGSPPLGSPVGSSPSCSCSLMG